MTQQMNAKKHVQEACNQLQTAQTQLNQAMGTVEKQQNRQKIQDALNAVNGALQTATNTLNSYQE